VLVCAEGPAVRRSEVTSRVENILKVDEGKMREIELIHWIACVEEPGPEKWDERRSIATSIKVAILKFYAYSREHVN